MQGLVDLFELKRSRHLLLLGAGIGLPATEGGQALYCLKWELKTSLSLAARGVVRQGALEEGETRGEQGA